MGFTDALRPAWVVLTTMLMSAGGFVLLISAALRLAWAIGYDNLSTSRCDFPRMTPNDNDSALYWLLVPWTFMIAASFAALYMHNMLKNKTVRLSMHIGLLIISAVVTIIAFAIHVETYCTPGVNTAMVTYVTTGVGLNTVFNNVSPGVILEHRAFLVAVYILLVTGIAMNVRVVRDGKNLLWHILPTSDANSTVRSHFFVGGIFGNIMRCVFFGVFCGTFGFTTYEFPVHSQHNYDQLGWINYGDITPPFDSSTHTWFADIRAALVAASTPSATTTARIDNVQIELQTECLYLVRNESHSRSFGQFPEAAAYSRYEDPDSQSKSMHAAIVVAFVFCIIEFSMRITGSVISMDKYKDQVPDLVHKVLTYSVMGSSIYSDIMMALAIIILAIQNSVHMCPVFTYNTMSIQYLLIGSFAYCTIDRLITATIDSLDPDHTSDAGTFFGLRSPMRAMKKSSTTITGKKFSSTTYSQMTAIPNVAYAAATEDFSGI